MKKKLIISVFILLCVIMSISVYVNIKNNSKYIQNKISDNKVKDNNQQQNNNLNSKKILINNIDGKITKYLENGIIFIYTSKCKNCSLIEKRITEIEKDNNFIDIKIINTDIKKDKDFLNKYMKDNKEDIDIYNKMDLYFRKSHTTINKVDSVKKAIDQFIILDTKYGSNIDNQTKEIQNEYYNARNADLNESKKFFDKITIALDDSTKIMSKNAEVSNEDKNKIKTILNSIVNLQELNIEELYDYVKLLSYPHSDILIKQIPESFEIINVIGGKISIIFDKDSPNFNSTLLNTTEQIDKFLNVQIEIQNYKNINEVNNLPELIKKENQFVYIYVNNCIACEKVEAILSKIIKNKNINLRKINLSYINNSRYYFEFNKEYGKKDQGNLPELRYFKNGIESESLNINKLKILNPNSSNGYDINEDIIKNYINQ